jgi:uncharacterized protein (DUF1810 family)
MTASETFDLEGFVTAQAPVFPAVLKSAEGGAETHSLDVIVFPQLRGLGHSSMAMFYGIPSLHAAREYLAHPVLGPRLARCTGTSSRSRAGHSTRYLDRGTT